MLADESSARGWHRIRQHHPRHHSLWRHGTPFDGVIAGANRASTTPGFTAGLGYSLVIGWGSYNAYQRTEAFANRFVTSGHLTVYGGIS